MFRLLQCTYNQGVKTFIKEIISFYMSATHLDDGYFGVAETYNCSVHLLLFGPKRDEVRVEWVKLHN
jgi:hypothetical protein